MIGPEIAEEVAAVLSTAIGALMEDASADAVRMSSGGWSVMVVKADRLKAVGADVAKLAEAMAVLARRADGEPPS